MWDDGVARKAALSITVTACNDLLTWQPEEPEKGTKTPDLCYPRLPVSRYFL